MNKSSIWRLFLQTQTHLASLDEAGLRMAKLKLAWLAPLALAAALMLFLGPFASSWLGEAVKSGGFFLLLVLGQMLAFLVFAASMRLLPKIEPLSQSSGDCLRALQCAQECPAASAWRDQALARGRELRQFDLTMMAHLRDQEREARACKALHRI